MKPPPPAGRSFFQRMKWRWVFLLLASISALGLLLLTPAKQPLKVKEQRGDEPDEALKFRLLQQQDENGQIPADGLDKARDQMAAMKAAQSAQARALGKGDGQFIAGIDPGAWIWLGPGNVGGRIRSILVDPTNPNHMWVGSVGGGIWTSTDAGISWQPAGGFGADLAVSSLVMDPTNPNVIYAGTGESFSASIDGTEGWDIAANGQRGAGVFKTTDGGVTWAQLPRTRPSDPAVCGTGPGINCPWSYVNRLAVSPNGAAVLAATVNGLQFSVDGGSTWNAAAGLAGNIQDVDFHPTDSTRAVASGAAQAAYSTDGGATWTQATFSNDGGATYTAAITGRVEIAYAPSNPLIVYISVAQKFTDAAMNVFEGDVYKSTDGGHKYIRVNARNNLLGGGGFYDNIIWVNPLDPNFVIVAGVLPYRSTDGGVTFSTIGDSSTNLPHTDHHMIVAHPGFNNTTNRTVYCSNDGGIFRFDDVAVPSPATAGWVSLNHNLGVTQFYSAAGNSAGVIISGSQDNGTLKFTGGVDTWSSIPGMGGDGGFCVSDPTDPNYFYGEYVYLQISRSTNGAASGTSIFSGIADAGVKTAANFIAPFTLDPSDPNTMLAGGQSLWRSTNVKAATPTWAAIKAPVSNGLIPPSNVTISAVTVSPSDSDFILVGHNDGQIYLTFNGTAATPIWSKISKVGAGTPARYVTRLVIDETRSPNWIYATYGGFSGDNIYRSTDFGASWTAVTGMGLTGLPSVPVRGFAINPVQSNYIYAGTEIGVFASEDAGATWKVPQDGPANVSVEHLFWLNGDLIAVTFGRGLYRTFSSVYSLPVCLGSGSGFWDDPMTWNNQRVPTSSDDVAVQCPITVRSGAQARNVRVNNHLFLNAPLFVAQDVANYGTIDSNLTTYSSPLLACRNLGNFRPTHTLTIAGIIQLPGGISATGDVVNSGFIALGQNINCAGLAMTLNSTLTMQSLTATGDVTNAGDIEGGGFVSGPAGTQHLSGPGIWKLGSFIVRNLVVLSGNVKLDVTTFDNIGTLDIEGGILTFTGATFNSGGGIAGAGTIRMAPTGGSALFNGNAPALTIASGTVKDQSGGTITGPLAVNAGATFQLTACHIIVRGDITVDGAITKENVFGGNIIDFFGQTFTNNGSVTVNAVRFNPSGPVPLAQFIVGTGAWGGDQLSLGNGSAAAPSTVTLQNDVTIGCAEFDIGYTLNLNGHVLTFTGGGNQFGVALSISGAVAGGGPLKMQPAGGTTKIRSLSAPALAPALEIVSGTVTADASFNTLFLGGKLTVDSGATLTLNGGLTALADVTINGSVNQTGNNGPFFNFQGNLFTNNGSIATSVGFFGPTLQNLVGTGSWGGVGTTLYAGGSATSITVLQNDLTFSGATFGVFGVLNTGIFTLSMPCSVAMYAFSSGDVVGNVRRTNLSACPGVALGFGNPFTTILFTAGVAPTDITVNTRLSSPPTFPGAVQRTYLITPSGGSGYTATLRLHYLDTELNGNDEAALQLVRLDGTGWNQQGATNRNTTNNWVEYSNVTQFSPWTLSSLTPPTSFAKWQAGFFTPAELANPAISGDAADPDGDGLSNLLEYALHLDPRQPSAAGAPYSVMDATYVSLIYTKVIDATDLTYAIEKSTDLINWSPVIPLNVILADDGITQSVKAQVPIVGAANMYLRLRVSR